MTGMMEAEVAAEGRRRCHLSLPTPQALFMLTKARNELLISGLF